MQLDARDRGTGQNLHVSEEFLLDFVESARVHRGLVDFRQRLGDSQQASLCSDHQVTREERVDEGGDAYDEYLVGKYTGLTLCPSCARSH